MADLQAVASDGAKAGRAQGDLQSDDSRVIAHTAMIGGGEADSVTVDVAQLEEGGEYSFLLVFQALECDERGGSSSETSCAYPGVVQWVIVGLQATT